MFKSAKKKFVWSFAWEPQKRLSIESTSTSVRWKYVQCLENAFSAHEFTIIIIMPSFTRERGLSSWSSQSNRISNGYWLERWEIKNRAAGKTSTYYQRPKHSELIFKKSKWSRE